MISWRDLKGSLDIFPSILQYQVLQGKPSCRLLSLPRSQESFTSMTNTLPDGGVTHNWMVILESWEFGLMNAPGWGKWFFLSIQQWKGSLECRVQCWAPVQGRAELVVPMLVGHRTSKETLTSCPASTREGQRHGGRLHCCLQVLDGWLERRQS